MKTFREGFYHHYKEDIAHAAEMGSKIFCMPVNWTSIFPTGLEERASEAGLRFYDEVFEELAGYKIEPLVTISQYEIPRGLAETYNGWQSREVIDHFMRFVSVIFARYQKTVRYWLIFNDINSAAMSLEELFSPGSIRGHKYPADAVTEGSRLCFQMLHHQFIAGARAVQFAHDRYPDFKIGNMYMSDAECPGGGNPDDDVEGPEQMFVMDRFCSDVQAIGFYPSYMECWFEENGIKIEKQPDDVETLLKGRIDFCTISDCMSVCENPDSAAPGKPRTGLDGAAAAPRLQAGERSRKNDPESLRGTLDEIWDRYQLPIMLVENGLGSHNQFTSLTGDLRRKRKDSIYWYQKNIQNNGRDLA